MYIINVAMWDVISTLTKIVRKKIRKRQKIFANFDKNILILRKLGKLYCIFLQIFSWFFQVNILVMSMWCQNITYKYDGWSQKLVSVSYFKIQFLLDREAKTQLQNTMSEKKILHFRCTYLLGHLDMSFMCVGSKLDIIVGARGFFIRGQKKSMFNKNPTFRHVSYTGKNSEKKSVLFSKISGFFPQNEHLQCSSNILHILAVPAAVLIIC